jgi:hypothetical protein
MAFAYIRRVAKGTGIDTPDNDHVHHRLVRLGHGPRRTVVILWTWTAALSGFVLFPLFAPESNAIIPFAAIVLGLLLFTLFRPGLRNERRKRRRGATRARAKTRAAVPVGAASGIEATAKLGVVSGNGAVPGSDTAPRIKPGPDSTGPTAETALN